MFRATSLLIVVAAIAVQGIVSGLWTHRWASQASIDAIVAATKLPMVAGEWEGREDPVLSREVRLSQAIAIARRIYANRVTGTSASVMLVSGRSGPVSVHTPDVCFPGSGFEADGKRGRLSLGTDAATEFWQSRFVKSAAGAIPISVYYAWNDGAQWQATETPRVAFAGRAVLYKLYVVIERTPGVDSEVDDSARDLLRALLPQLTISK